MTKSAIRTRSAISNAVKKPTTNPATNNFVSINSFANRKAHVYPIQPLGVMHCEK